MTMVMFSFIHDQVESKFNSIINASSGAHTLTDGKIIKNLIQ